MPKYLVTGGAGFIGSHIVERLLGDGHSVVVLDNFSSGKQENLLFINNSPQYAAGFKLFKGDIRDSSTCDNACQGVDFVLHQAALRSVPKSLENPVEYNQVNINGTLNMLEASRKHKVKRFVLASSSSVYGDTAQFPEQETDLPVLISPYALTKLAGEYYCRVYSHNYNLPTVCLRYFNVYGPRQALDDEYAVVIPKFINCILSNEPPPIFGNGKQSRDFTYIDNVVEANLLACKAPELKWAVFNIANGKNQTILELVALLNKIINKNIQPVYLPIRAGDVFKTLADISQAKKILGYHPGVNFQEGLERTVRWFKENQRG
ncbi:MAG: SDR family oxidoreductase [Candidatus Omnitrophota bacterium]|jgi:nucleoside-diphosphate-sugar epimerase